MMVDFALQTNGNLPSFFGLEAEGDTFKEAAFNALRKYAPKMKDEDVEPLFDEIEGGYLYSNDELTAWVWPYHK